MPTVVVVHNLLQSVLCYEGAEIVDRWQVRASELNDYYHRHDDKAEGERLVWVYSVRHHKNKPFAGKRSMTDQTTSKNTPAPARAVLTDGAKLAASLVATKKLNKIATAMVVKALGRTGLPEPLLDHPGMGRVLRLLAPLVVAQFAESLPGVGGQAPTIRRGCTLAFAGEVQDLLGPMIDEFGPLVDDLKAAASAMGAPAGDNIPAHANAR